MKLKQLVFEDDNGTEIILTPEQFLGVQEAIKVLQIDKSDKWTLPHSIPATTPYIGPTYATGIRSTSAQERAFSEAGD